MESPGKQAPKENEKSTGKASVRQSQEAKAGAKAVASSPQSRGPSTVHLRTKLANRLQKVASCGQATFSQQRCKSGKYTRTSKSNAHLTTDLSSSNNRFS
jgi:hypothetical protein